MNIKDIIKNYDCQREKLKGLPKQAKEEIYDETSQLIEYFENMSSKAEERRSSIYNSAANNLNLIVAFLTLVVTVNISKTDLFLYFVPAYIFAILSLVNAIVLIIVFWMQSTCKYVTKDARLKDYGNYWKRFYYGNEYITNISTSLKIHSKVSGSDQNNAFDEESVAAYLQGLNFIMEEYVSEDIDTKIEKNIKQLYLMQVHNYYKNRYNLSLTKINNKFTIIKIVLTVVSIIGVLIVLF